MTAWLRSQVPSLPEDHTGLGFSGLGFRVQDLGFGGVWGLGSSNSSGGMEHPNVDPAKSRRV